MSDEETPEELAGQPVISFATVPDCEAWFAEHYAPDVDDPDSVQRSKFYNFQLAATQVINSDAVIGGYYQHLRSKRQNDDGPLGVGFQSAFTSKFDGTIDTSQGSAP